MMMAGQGTQELDSLRKQCEEYKETILFQANEIRILRKSLSDNICQRCKSKIDPGAFKEEAVTASSSVSAAASALPKAPNSRSFIASLFKSQQSSGSSSTSPSARSDPNSRHIALPGGPTSPPLQCSSNSINIASFPTANLPICDVSNTRPPASISKPNSQHIAMVGGYPSRPSQRSSNNSIASSPTIFFNRQVEKELDVKLAHSLKFHKRVLFVKFSPDGRRLAAACGRGTRIYDTTTWKSICVLQDLFQKDENDVICAVSFSADGEHLAAASHDRLIRVWEVSRWHVRNAFKGHKSFVRSVDFSPDGSLLASSSDDGRVRIWSMRDGTSVFISDDRPNVPLFSVVLSPDGIYIVAGGALGVLGIWNVRTGHLVKWLEGHRRAVTSLSFMPDGKGLMSGSWDYMLKHWDTGSLQMDPHSMRKDKVKVKVNHENGELVELVGQKKKGMQSFRDFTGHTNSVNSVTISSNGRWVASGSDDQGVRIWDTRNAEMKCILNAHNSDVASVHFSPVGNYLASSDRDGHVRIWRCEEV